MFIEQIGVPVTLYTSVRDVANSNLSHATAVLNEVFHFFPLSHQIDAI
jgi:hypothetical protein